MCPHGGQVLATPSQSKVLLGGQPALLVSDPMVILGCPFTVGPKYQPCVTVTWTGPATRVQINGQAPLLQTSVGLCKSAESVPQGNVVMMGVQTKVMAE
jgi:hypothetical protein